jgi:hypothetical protein
MAREYTQEIGIPSHKKTMSRPVAYVILAIVAVGVSFGVAGVISKTKEHHEAEKPVSAPASSAAEPVPVTPPASK